MPFGCLLLYPTLRHFLLISILFLILHNGQPQNNSRRAHWELEFEKLVFGVEVEKWRNLGHSEWFGSFGGIFGDRCVDFGDGGAFGG